MSASVVIKNTFICVVDDEEVMSPKESRIRAKSFDVALGKQDVLIADGEEVEEEPPSPSGAAASAHGLQHAGSLAAGLKAGGVVTVKAADEICRSARNLAFDAPGSSLVLRAFEVAPVNGTVALVEGLRGWVGEAVRSAHACRVLEHLVRSAGTENAAFIAEELLMCSPQSLVLNANASSILCLMMEYSAGDARTMMLVDSVLSVDVETLCGHKFGHNVAMSVLSNGSARQRWQILSALRSDVQRFARHRFASKVFEQALVICPDDERRGLALEVLARPSTVVALACHSFGVNIVRELLQVPDVSHQVLLLLTKSVGRVSRDKFGLELMHELGLQKKPQPRCVLDLTCELGLEKRGEYEAGLRELTISGA